MSQRYATGISQNSSHRTLYRRHATGNERSNEVIDIGEGDLEDIIEKTSKLKLEKQKGFLCDDTRNVLEQKVFPLLLTALSAFMRIYRIDANDGVVWDEAHFGKFGSYYLKREFYFDVHPPLGKLLVALSGYLADYTGNFAFESGQKYPDDCNYVLMRCLNCLFGILCTPLAYKTALALGYSQWTVWLVSLLVVFEMLSLTLSKFILLDSFLLFFTVLSFYLLIKVHNILVQDRLFTFEGLLNLVFTGIAIGCVCSVKWVGMFTTAVIGFYIIYDLAIKSYALLSKNRELSLSRYLLHWAVRIFLLIIVPFMIYVACFRVHFKILNRSGTGDGSISTLLQASLEGSSVVYGPRSVAYGSLVTLRSQGLSPNLLHSHPHFYPEGSQQQQITTYGFKDENNEFLIELDIESGLAGEFATFTSERNNTVPRTRVLQDGDTVRLIHSESGCLLHSHRFPSAITKGHFEVSCYADLYQSDPNDEWIIEIKRQEISPSPFFQNESMKEVHPISTSFRLKHKTLGCYLTTTGYSYPAWGYNQGEVTCKHTLFDSDKTTWWNVEDHVNKELPVPPEDYVPPKPRFWKEFILLNYNMMTSNNALIPDPDKFDRLSSMWWEWPILKSGLRMCGWGADDTKYFLIGHPVVTWMGTFSVLAFVFYLLVSLWRWQRQKYTFPGGVYDSDWNRFVCQGALPFIAWLLHYVPFIIMGRVTYLHHYIPALYFSIFVWAFMMENVVRRYTFSYLSVACYLISYGCIIYFFWYLRDLSFGMDKPSASYRNLRLLSSWMV